MSKEAAEVFNLRAKEYQDKFWDVNLYAESLDHFCSILKRNAEVLELACGPGNVTSYLLRKRPDLKILATDLSEQMIRLTKVNNPNAEVKLMDCRALGSLQKRYDALIMSFGLPYLSKEEAQGLIKDAATVLVPDGVIYLSTMEDKYENSGIQTSSYGDKVYMYYHELKDLEAALQESGFFTLHVTRQPYPPSDGVTDLIIIGRKSQREKRSQSSL